ncbi:unnamed protein product [Cyprideis torosa]|uniref:Transketolase-like pyrimidine-binding domain-containing protein n=1 Tax=Cyprideis torosa TaxID=163714 RepID=A0A7R8WW00_9CRUS|nr:unnamed protein product [Cyprideis torosa]CAG0908007.1 unnamed protein product [Cyprideis torosa]
MRFIDAISDAIDTAMTQYPNLILMGQDIAKYGGVFKVTDGMMDKYGKDRVRNTPLCEAAIVGVSQGLSINGYKSMMEFQFADFVTEGFNQISEVPMGYYNIPFGEASTIISGVDLTIVAYGQAVHWSIEALKNNPHISAELIDLRTLVPLDMKKIISSVKKTSKLLIVQEDNGFVSICSEIAAQVQKECFYELDAPIFRVSGLETPIPFSEKLEQNYMANSRLDECLLELYRF